MAAETPGITRAGAGLGGTVWNILGQTYHPKQECEASFAFEALSPPGTFVPVHVHPTQDEFIYVLEGGLEVRVGDVPAAGDAYVLDVGEALMVEAGAVHTWRGSETSTTRCLWVEQLLEGSGASMEP